MNRTVPSTVVWSHMKAESEALFVALFTLGFLSNDRHIQGNVKKFDCDLKPLSICYFKEVLHRWFVHKHWLFGFK